MNLFKKLKLTYFFISFIACSSPGSIDYEENGRQVGSRPDQDTSNSIAPPSFLALGDSYTIGEGVNGDQDGLINLLILLILMVLKLINQLLLLRQDGKHMIYLMQ